MEEPVYADGEPVPDTEEPVSPDTEEAGEEEVLHAGSDAPSGRVLLELVSATDMLPDNEQALAKIARSWAAWAQCLVELRDTLRRLGVLYDGLAREIARELRAERAKLLMAGLRVLSLRGGCRGVGDELLARLCREAEERLPGLSLEKLVRWMRGARRPDIVLSYMCRYHEKCCPLRNRYGPRRG